jgi:hypothetical protein
LRADRQSPDFAALNPGYCYLLAYKGKDYKAQAIQSFWIYDGNELKLARH